MDVWIKVSADKYELPVAIADTPLELARLCGTTANTISSTWSHYKKGKIKKSSYVKVRLEE